MCCEIWLVAGDSYCWTGIQCDATSFLSGACTSALTPAPCDAGREELAGRCAMEARRLLVAFLDRCACAWLALHLVG